MLATSLPNSEYQRSQIPQDTLPGCLIGTSQGLQGIVWGLGVYKLRIGLTHAVSWVWETSLTILVIFQG